MQHHATRAVGPISSTRFSVNGLPACTRYGVWHDSISCMFDVDNARRPRDAAAFHASVEMHRIGNLLLARADTVSQRWRRSARTIARDGMDHVMIQYYRRGTQRCQWRGGTVDMPAGGLLVYDLSRRMRARTSDLSNLSLILPRAALESLVNPPEEHHMRALDARLPRVAALRDCMIALHRNARAMRLASTAELAQGMPELLAACLNEGSGRAVEYLAPHRALAVRRDIGGRLHEPELGRDTLAHRHGLCPETLDELFAANGGVAAYLRERRMRAALRVLLRAPEAPVGEVAVRVGYPEAAFVRAFRRRFGVLPQHAAALCPPSPSEVRIAEIDRRYEYWLTSI